MISVLFLPMWNKIDMQVGEVVEMNAFEIVYSSIDETGAKTPMATEDTFWVGVLAILASGIAIFSIFQYRKRLLQMKLGAVNSLVMGGCLLLAYYYSTKGDMMLNPSTVGNYQLGFYIIAMAVACNSLANRFIRRDEKLVRSADRIR